MKTPFGLIIKCNFKSIQDYEIALTSVKLQTEKWIWLVGDLDVIGHYVEKMNASIKKENIKILCESENLIDKGLMVSALSISDFTELTNIKEKYPALLVGGIANDLAESKNIELFKGDFVCLGPIEDIGEMPYITIIPEKPDYEWRFIDITIPVIGFGIISTKRLEKLTEIVNLSGFACNRTNFEKHTQVQLRFPII